MSITSQLKKMSQKTIESINENDRLTVQIAKLKLANSLLVDSEKQFSKRNNANQKVIKMLVSKLKESDDILDHAFDDLQDSKMGSEEQVLTDEMIQEIQEIQNDYNSLVDRINELNSIGVDLIQVIKEAKIAREQYGEKTIVNYFMTSNLGLANRILDLTQLNDDERVFKINLVVRWTSRGRF
jgi:hypothetical protein